MKRAKLITDEVDLIVVGSTMTAPDEDPYTTDGMHFFIDRRGVVTTPVPDDERGSYLPRYSRRSILIVLEGGYTDDGIPSAGSYWRNQLLSVEAICRNMLKKYPNSKLTMWHELKKGINPIITPDDINMG